MTAVLVVIFGGLGIWFNNESFFKMKPTILYTLFAVTLGVGMLRGKSYLQLVMDEAVPLKHEGWMILTGRMALYLAALAVTNEIVWRSMSTDAWVNFKTFGLPGSMFVFFFLQMRLFTRYSVETKKSNDQAD